MKLDNDLLKQMIAEALEEVSKYTDQMSRDAQKEKDSKKDDKKDKGKKGVNVSGGRVFDFEDDEPSGLEEVIKEEEDQSSVQIANQQSKVATEKQKVAKEEEKLTNLKAAAAKENAAQAAQKAGATMEESFQLTKGRLRQIIREELISAKKQGLL